MKYPFKTAAASMLLAAFALGAQAQPTNTGNTSGSGAKSPDTTRPDGAKGSGVGTPDPSPAAAAGDAKNSKATGKAKGGTNSTKPEKNSANDSGTSPGNTTGGKS